MNTPGSAYKYMLEFLATGYSCSITLICNHSGARDIYFSLKTGKGSRMCIWFIPSAVIGATQLGTNGTSMPPIVSINDWVPEQCDLISAPGRLFNRRGAVPCQRLAIQHHTISCPLPWAVCNAGIGHFDCSVPLI